MLNVIPYKSFCWSLGTTSFRTKNFNKTIDNVEKTQYNIDKEKEIRRQRK